MYIYNKDCEIVDLGNGLRRKVLAHGGSLMGVEVYFDTGTAADLHSHPHEQLTYVVSGEFEFTIGNETKLVKVGDTLYKQPNIIHGCVCISAGMLLDIFTPQRQDFLEN
jgi:quercetin dioxygenase-like cupin family protein